jgi:hypothetical protein
MLDVGLAIKSAEELDKAVGTVAKLAGKLKATSGSKVSSTPPTTPR